jgi:hypothetical protein
MGTVSIRMKNLLALVPARNQVVEGAGKMDSRFLRHSFVREVELNN